MTQFIYIKMSTGGYYEYSKLEVLFTNISINTVQHMKFSQIMKYNNQLQVQQNK